MLKRNRYQTHDPHCNLGCNQLQENTLHVLQCQHPAAKALWDSELNASLKWMLLSDIVPDIATSIISNLQQWYNHEHPANSCSGNHLIVQAMRSQTNIGWNTLLEGI